MQQTSCQGDKACTAVNKQIQDINNLRLCMHQTQPRGRLPSTLLFYFLPGPTVGIYYSSQFTPLIVFFLLFLSIVKNTKLPHFVRFNCMQSIMLDIVVMLFNILRSIMLDIVVMLFNILRQYFPSELRWSLVMSLFDMFSWSICMSIILYCVFFALVGKYGDVPYVSESVYIQVDASEYGG
ncbi:hypothetical protein WJX72_009724 [[Myrmecia] bisecta]|uniref:Protein TIC 20 n=1 Tax=[Myrmecia] bisecta TaxID=41462 RepID=A0AAW1QAR8_9CHLO